MSFDGTSSKEVANRDQLVSSMSEAALRARKGVEAIRSQLHATQSERRELERSVSTIESKRSSLANLDSNLSKWRSALADSSSDTELAALVEQERQLNEEMESAKQRIAQTRRALQAQLERVRTVFNAVVQAALSAEFNGTLLMEDGLPEFSILHGEVLAGEAIASLKILLVDLTCMMLATAGRATFPGLLIHDSPREADLGGTVYSNYLNYVASLHEDSGGGESAPFQYIVTTTTAPPPGVRSKAHVCLKLSSEFEDDLLFRKRLGQRLPDPQRTLAFHDAE